MRELRIEPNEYLPDQIAKRVRAYYHTPYVGYNKPGNPDYLNVLKNTFNDYSEQYLSSAVIQLMEVLLEDLPQIPKLVQINPLYVCVVPRAKAEHVYHPYQLLFRSTVQYVVNQVYGLVDATSYLVRHTNTKTTHLRKPIPNYNNDGPDPYPGITRDTCKISPEIRDKDILLIDDIYTPGVNIVEDAICAIVEAGAATVTFYAVGYTIQKVRRS